MEETFLSRVNYRLNEIAGCNIALAIPDPEVLDVAAYAVVGAGGKKLSLIGDRRMTNKVKDSVQAWLGAESDTTAIACYSNSYASQCLPFPARTIFIIDAGESNADRILARLRGRGFTAFYFCRVPGGLALGEYSGRLPEGRMPAAAESAIFTAIAHLLIWLITKADGYDADPAPECAFIASDLVDGRQFYAAPDAPLTLGFFGGGGAIAMNILLNMHHDPMVRKLLDAPNVKLVVIDPGTIHEGCRARQRIYQPEDNGKSKAAITAERLGQLFPRAQIVSVPARVDEEAFKKFKFNFAFFSIDNWPGRKVASALCQKYAIPFISAGSSHDGGMARCCDQTNRFCVMPETGTEGLDDRADLPVEDHTSCSYQPRPASQIPQLIISHQAVRQFLLSRTITDYEREHELAKYLARGVEVHMKGDSKSDVESYKNLRLSPGRLINVRPE